MDVHWRYTMKPARLGPIDARAVFPILLVLLHIQSYTIVFALLIIFILWLFEKNGWEFNAALRTIRAWLVNPNRPAIDPRRHSRRVDLYWRDMALMERYEKWALIPLKN